MYLVVSKKHFITIIQSIGDDYRRLVTETKNGEREEASARAKRLRVTF